MAIGADDLAFRDFVVEDLAWVAACDQTSKIGSLLAPNVIEVEELRRRLTAVEAARLTQNRRDVASGGRVSPALGSIDLLAMAFPARAKVGLEAVSAPVLALAGWMTVERFDRLQPPTASARLQSPADDRESGPADRLWSCGGDVTDPHAR
jgi:hypothetical protein